MRRLNQGFTLIEVLVVMVILGVLAGAVALSVGDRGKDAHIKESAQRFFGLTQMLSDEALFENKDLAIYFTPEHYEFYYFSPPETIEQPGTWQKYTSPPFKSHELEESLSFELNIEDERVDLNLVEEGDLGDDGVKKITPQLIFWASGEMPLFELIIIDDNPQIQRYAIASKSPQSIELNALSEDVF
jgi:general secretion pathway protein H